VAGTLLHRDAGASTPRLWTLARKAILQMRGRPDGADHKEMGAATKENAGKGSIYVMKYAMNGAGP